MNPSVVVAFPESPALRETLAVLLEHDCELRFLEPAAAAASDCAAASVALVAVRRPVPVVHDLRRHWPTVPIVAVDVADAPPELPPRDSLLFRVPLEPHAIRATVLQHLAPDHHAALRMNARVIAETLRAALSYSFVALRSFSALHASSPGPDTYALLGTAVREQSHLLSEAIEQLERFRRRPRAAELSAEFPAALCRQLEGLDHLGSDRGALCHYAVDAACAEAGPVELAPTVAAFLRAHVRRTADGAVVGVRLTRQGIVMRYRLRRASAASRSWPLLLAGLALQPWSWSVSTQIADDQEVVSLRRAA